MTTLKAIDKTYLKYFQNLNPKFISWDFYEQYLDKEPPFGTIGSVVFLRTYSHYLPELGRREYWCEVVLRCVEFSLSVEDKTLFPDQVKEAELLFDLWFNLKAFPAGRTLWVGNPNKQLNEANFNCSFRVIDSIEAYQEMCHLLMLGVGVGFSVEKKYTEKFPLLKNKVVKHLPYIYDPVLENTIVYCDGLPSLDFQNDILTAKNITIKIGDSRKGWEDALLYYLYCFSSIELEEITINYDSIRPVGTRLKTMGGRASGHEPLKRFFEKINWIIFKADGKHLSSVDLVDIATCLAEAIVVGGVRRSSLIALGDPDDQDFITMKENLWIDSQNTYDIIQVLENTPDCTSLFDVDTYSKSIAVKTLIDQLDNDCPKYRWRTSRVFSNNSIMLETIEEENMRGIFNSIISNGEPGFIFKPNAEKRRVDFKGVNPCSEILLDNQGVCNLVEINLLSFVEEKEGEVYLNEGELRRAIKLSTRHCLRITEIDFWHKDWTRVQKRDRLLGVSLTGIVEAFNKLGWKEESHQNFFDISGLYGKLQVSVDKEASIYSRFLGIPKPLLTTCIKPSGSLSNLPGVSSGIHAPYSPYYIRRVRVSKEDPIAKALLSLEIPVVPENGYKDLESSPIWVFSFYIKTNASIKSSEESAIKQLERYKTVMEHYVQHNCSITVSFKEKEVSEIINWLANKKNNRYFVGVSFLPSYEGVYPNLPYESISEEKYLELSKNQVIPTEKDLNALISFFESEEKEYMLENECSGGACPVR